MHQSKVHCNTAKIQSVLTPESDREVIWIVEGENLLVSALIFKIEGNRWWVHKHWDLYNAWLHATLCTCNKYNTYNKYTKSEIYCNSDKKQLNYQLIAFIK